MLICKPKDRPEPNSEPRTLEIILASGPLRTYIIQIAKSQELTSAQGRSYGYRFPWFTKSYKYSFRLEVRSVGRENDFETFNPIPGFRICGQSLRNGSYDRCCLS